MATRTDLYGVLVSEVVIEEGFNVRYDMGDLQELCDSIVERGIMNPIHAYTKKGDINRYTIVEGHRRIAAVNLAIEQGKLDGATFRIPMVKSKPMSDIDRTLSLITFNSGKPLHMLEEATVYERAIAYGATEAEMAKRTGRSKTHVTNCLLLLTASKKTKKMIVDGSISSTQVINLLKKMQPSEVDTTIEDAVKRVKEERSAAKSEATKSKSSLFEDDDDGDLFPKEKDAERMYADDDIPYTIDNTKTTGKNTQELDEDSGEPIKITAKNLNAKKNTSYKKEYILNLLREEGIGEDEKAFVILQEKLID